MSQAIFHVVPQHGDLFTVEMTAESGNRCLIPDFRTKAEADAWIVQTKRMLDARDPLHKVVQRLGSH
jgi:hypothetical protein